VRQATSLLFKSFHEFVSADEISSLPKKIRGLYALYRKEKNDCMNLMYVGMTDAGAKGRLFSHSKGSKVDQWTHCSVYEVWDNITQEQIAELEALFRHTLRKDAAASSLNVQRESAIFRKLRQETAKRLKGAA